jgi:hypothetical protein
VKYKELLDGPLTYERAQEYRNTRLDWFYETFRNGERKGYEPLDIEAAWNLATAHFACLDALNNKLDLILQKLESPELPQ